MNFAFIYLIFKNIGSRVFGASQWFSIRIGLSNASFLCAMNKDMSFVDILPGFSAYQPKGKSNVINQGFVFIPCPALGFYYSNIFL